MSNYRILSIDDDPEIRMLLKTALSLKYTVETAENGMEGVRLLDTFAPDFIILDINMPVMNGFEAAEAIRSHPKFFAVPIFFLSAEKGADIPRKSYEVGGNLFLRKPLDPMRLLGNIEYFLQTSKLQPGAHGVTPRAASTPAAPLPAAAPVTGGGPLRVLTVDAEPDTTQRLRRLFGVNGDAPCAIAGGPFETIWVTDPYKAFGNIARWDPELVIYNSQHPVIDGIAFHQYLKLKNENKGREIVLITSRVLEPVAAFSQNVLRRGLIDLIREDGLVATMLGEAAACARKLLHPKQLAFSQIEAEDAEMQRQLQKKQLEKTTMRERYADIQRYIDTRMSD